MVYLSRICTRTGDGGETSLGDGSRLPKDHPRVAAYGSVDELNAALGLLLTQGAAEAELLHTTQNDLFDVLAVGDHWGGGTFTPGARPGRKPLGVAFELRGNDPADLPPPQGARWLQGYLGTRP